jgi:hypothetical protein
MDRSSDGSDGVDGQLGVDGVGEMMQLVGVAGDDGCTEIPAPILGSLLDLTADDEPRRGRLVDEDVAPGRPPALAGGRRRSVCVENGLPGQGAVLRSLAGLVQRPYVVAVDQPLS